MNFGVYFILGQSSELIRLLGYERVYLPIDAGLLTMYTILVSAIF